MRFFSGWTATVLNVLLTGSLLAATPPARSPVKPKHLTPDELATVPRDGTFLLLHGAVFDPLVSAPDFAMVGLAGPTETGYGIVQFRPGRLAEKDRLQALGVLFVGYLPDNAFVVRLTPVATGLLAGNSAVRWSGPYEAGFRVHYRLWPGSKDVTPEVTVQFFRDATTPQVSRVETQARRLAPSAVKTFSRSDAQGTVMRFAVTTTERDRLVASLAQLDGVSFIEPFTPPVLHNNSALGPLQSNVASVIATNACSTCTIFTHGLTGTGQIVTVADSGNDSDMCFFRYGSNLSDVTDAASPIPPATGPLWPANKLVGYWIQPGATAYDNNATCPGGSSTSYHGSHTSATVVGDDFANLSTSAAPGINPGDGMAPNAKLLFQDVGHDTTGCLTGLDDPFNMYLQALGGGARIHSNSYGSAAAGAYTGDCSIADRFLFDHEEMTIFFSAGNSGSAANTVGSPGTAKNVVTVGALGSANSTSVAFYSSRGPTDDGRAKPDVMAPGTVTSASGDANHTSNNCTTTGMSGTSMATPATAGLSTLLRQYFSEGYYPTGGKVAANAFEAGAPLVKAVLLNGTLQLGTGFGVGNNSYGWGRAFLDNNLFFSGDTRSLRVWNKPNVAGLLTGQSDGYSVSVAAGQEFRVTLVWSDPEPAGAAATALVNNLDLTVTDGVNTYRGNVFVSNQSTTGGSADTLNNVEQVRITLPTAGTYTVTVNATGVPGNGRAYTNRQGYALVVSRATCVTAVAAAPTALAVASHAPMGVDVSWTPAASSTVTQVYRALGGCSASAGSFQFIGSTAGSSMTDTTAQGGFTYGYQIRGADSCGEGPVSSCQEITPTGTCNLVPGFAGLASAAPASNLCRVALSWGSATSSCPAGSGVRYNVYRSTTPGFAPGAGNLLTTVTGVTTYNDDAVTSATTYYYVVRAEDTSTGGPGPNGGNEESNSAMIFATPFGSPGAAIGTWTDNGGDTNAYLSPQAPWQVTSTLGQTGARSYHCGPDVGSYPANICASITTPALALASGSVLSYWVNYNIEYQWDGVVVEISQNGGPWTNLPPTTPAGYPTTLAQTQGNACGYLASQGAFSGPTTNAALTGWTQIQTALTAGYDNSNVQIRWRFTTDGGAEYQGLYLDSVSVTNVFLPSTCTTTPVDLIEFRVD